MPAIPTNRGAIWVAHQRSRGNPVLVLLHGAGGNRLQWPAELRRLKGVELLAVDLPGHDRSHGPARDSVDAYAEDVVALLDALQIERVFLLGHSMGGAVGLSLALAHPDRVQGLVLAATSARLPVASALLEGDDATVAERLVEWSWGPGADPTLQEKHRYALHALDAGTLHTDLTACSRFDVRGRLNEITAPALVLVGEHDRMVAPRMSHELADGLPNAQRVVFDSGHMLMLEQPQAVVASVSNWLQK